MSEKQTLDPVVLRKAFGDRFSLFASFMQGEEWFDPKHEELCDFLQYHVEQALAKKEDFKGLVIMPRGSLKTTMCTKLFPIWCTLPKEREPWTPFVCQNFRSLLATNTFPNARKKLEDIRGLYDTNELFRAVYPDLLPTRTCRWTDEVAEINRPARFPEGTFECAGKKTRKEGTHYNLIVEDDTCAPEDSDLKGEIITPSVETIQQATNWHRSGTALLVPKGPRMRLVVSTRWSEFDLVDYLQKNEPGYHVFDVPAIREDGSRVFTMFYDEKTLRDIKEQVGEYLFSALYLNKPLDPSLRVFQDAWFHYVHPTEVPFRQGNVSIAVDPAISERDEACESAITKVLHQKKDKLHPHQYWVEAVSGHFNPDELIEKTLALVDDPENTTIIVESVAYQASLKYSFWNAMVKRGWNLPIIAYNSRASKDVRIRGLVPFFATGRIHLISGLNPKVESQLKQYPNGRLVDIIDAFSMHYRALEIEETVPIAKPKKPMNTYWDEVMEAIEEKEKQRKTQEVFTMEDVDFGYTMDCGVR